MRTDLVGLATVLGLALLSMPIYRATEAGRSDPLDMTDRGSFVLGGFVRSWFYWFIRPIERLALALRVSPTALNVVGALLGMWAGLAFGVGRVSLGGWLVLAGGAADVLDGRVARALGVAGPRGAFLDSTLDRFAEVGAFVGLAVFFRDSVPALLAVTTGLGGSLLVSYARARGESVGVTCKLGVMQRAERLLAIGFGGVLDGAVTDGLGWSPGGLLLVALIAVAAGTVATAAYRTVWIALRLE